MVVYGEPLFRPIACHVLWSGQILNEYFGRLAPVFQKLDSAIHRINRYPMKKYYQK